MHFDSDRFSLIAYFDVLRHMPNVSKVADEFFRILKAGGNALVCEPIISMGDWRKLRTGLTKRERGIPFINLRNFVERSRFKVISERKCMFLLTSRLRHRMRGSAFNNTMTVALDDFLYSLSIWPNAYHVTSVLQKLLPTAVFFVLQNPIVNEHNA